MGRDVSIPNVADLVEELFSTRDETYKTNYSDVIQKIAMNIDVKEEDIKKVVDAIPFIIKDSLQVEGDRVVIKGLGSWALRKRKVNKGLKNSPDKEDMLIISFSASRNLVPYNSKKQEKDK